ncbi:MAG TPA: serine/threonine-protein kinase, partial [Thermoanaerobaculia bacterium]|nr:serine/threonine-protein kinase [Thermoanaerobaculia bacterium]
MKTIQVKSCVSTDFDPVFNTIKTIEIEDQWIGRGGFGVAYRALSFDGKQTHPQIVKILFETGNGAAQHGFATIRGLQDRLRRENQAMSGKLLQTLPAMQAVPQMSFEGVLDGVPVVGYTSNDLTSGGFVEFGKILDDDAQLATLQKLPLSAKMRIALELVAAFDFLKSKILFIHADIKAEALFLDLKGKHCAIIDFDGGALASSINDSPTTFGTPQDWLAPEIARQLTTPGRTGKIKVNLSSDAWSVNVAIHYILFGVSPFFFLSEVSDRSMDAFLKKHQWPECDPSFRYFAAGVAPAHKAYLAYLRSAVRPEIVEKLKVTINKGYGTPAQRIMYGSWKI